jgi:hypothetical protein
MCYLKSLTLVTGHAYVLRKSILYVPVEKSVFCKSGSCNDGAIELNLTC